MKNIRQTFDLLHQPLRQALGQCLLSFSDRVDTLAALSAVILAGIELAKESQHVVDNINFDVLAKFVIINMMTDWPISEELFSELEKITLVKPSLESPVWS